VIGRYEHLFYVYGEITKGAIMHYYGALKGIVVGGLQHLFNPIQVGCSLNKIQYTPPTSRTLKELSKADLENEICQVQNDLVEKTWAR
jgi:hypothetical protein